MPFPTQDELEESDLDLIVSGSKDAILMIEGFAREMPEDRMLEALARGAPHTSSEICDMQTELFAKANVEKRQYEVPPDDGLFDRLKAKLLRRASRGQADRRASRPGPRPWPS